MEHEIERDYDDDDADADADAEKSINNRPNKKNEDFISRCLLLVNDDSHYWTTTLFISDHEL